MIDLSTLITECSKLALHAGACIRKVHTERREFGQSILQGYNKETFDEKSVATVADLRAQRIIIQELRLLYPGLVIVGEE